VSVAAKKECDRGGERKGRKSGKRRMRKILITWFKMYLLTGYIIAISIVVPQAFHYNIINGYVKNKSVG
jgi:hypothetical protein